MKQEARDAAREGEGGGEEEGGGGTGTGELEEEEADLVAHVQETFPTLFKVRTFLAFLVQINPKP